MVARRMSSTGLIPVNSGPLIIRTLQNESVRDTNTYVLGEYDYPISSNYVLITSSYGILAPTNHPNISTITVSTLIDDTGSAGTSGQVLTAGTGSQVVWANPGGISSINYWTAVGSSIHNNNTGNVGIGLTSPQAALDVNGTTNITSMLTVHATSTSDTIGNGMAEFHRIASSGTETVDYQVTSNPLGFGDFTWTDARYVYYHPGSIVQPVWGIVTSTSTTIPMEYSTIGSICFFKNAQVCGNFNVNSTIFASTVNTAGPIYGNNTAGYVSTSFPFSAPGDHPVGISTAITIPYGYTSYLFNFMCSGVPSTGGAGTFAEFEVATDSGFTSPLVNRYIIFGPGTGAYLLSPSIIVQNGGGILPSSLYVRATLSESAAYWVYDVCFLDVYPLS